MRAVTVSEIRTFRTCERLWFYKYEQGFRPALESKALLIGSAVHSALEMFWTGRSKGDALGKLEEICVGSFWESDTGLLEATRCNLMICGYFNFWESQRSKWKTLPGGVEKVIQLGLDHDLVLAGKVDALARYEDGRLFMIEHKTSSDDVESTGSDYWQRLALDSQIDTYQHVLEKEFGEPVSILYDVLKKIGTAPKMKKAVRKRKDETDEDLEKRKAAERETLAEFGSRILIEMTKAGEQWFVRREITRLDDQRAEHIVERDHTLAAMFAPGRDVYPRNDGACMARFGTCPFLGVCAGTATLDDPKFARLDDIHPELEGKLELAKEPSDQEDQEKSEQESSDGNRDPGPIPF